MTTEPIRTGPGAGQERPQHGITLIEMIIVMAILGIVASLVYPSYVERTRKARRVDATGTLMKVAGEQERFFLRNNRYAGSAAELGISTSENGLYEIEIEALNGGTEFVATARPATGKGQDLDTDCGTLSIDQLGRKTSTGGTAGGDTSSLCWR